MARMPGTNWLGEHAPIQSDGKRLAISRYDCVCYHTIVGYAPAHAAHFSVHMDGDIDQSRDTRYRSAANLEGNHRIIAIENEDENRKPIQPLTAAQVESNAQILAWAHETHGVPLQLAPNSKPTSRGLAYHRQGIDGNFGTYKYGGRVVGGEHWSTSFGKTCPTDPRIDQKGAILARAKQLVEGNDDMPLSDADKTWILAAVRGEIVAKIDDIAREVWNVPHTDPRAPEGKAAINMKILLDRMRKDTAAAADKEALAASIKRLDAGAVAGQLEIGVKDV